MNKLIRPISFILLFAWIVLVEQVPSVAACTTGRNFWAGAYQWDYNVGGVRSSITARDPYNPNTTYYFNSGRVLLAVWDPSHSYDEAVEIGWRKGQPFGNSVVHYVGVIKQGWNIYYRGNATPGTAYQYRIDHVGSGFYTYLNGVNQRYDSLDFSTVGDIEVTGETNNDCASMGSSSQPTYLSSLSIADLSWNWFGWTSWSKVADAPYHADWNFWDNTNIWAWGP